MSLDWGYSRSNGPATWAQRYPLAAGSRQSPVDIDTGRAESDAALEAEPLAWRYGGDSALALANTGYGWKVDADGAGSALSGGPLEARYTLEQFHCHWGGSSGEGSEHTVDGRAFAGELHLVHWNSSKYASFGEAAAQPDGLAVLGVLLQAGEPHEELQKIVNLMPDVLHRGQKVKVKEPIDPTKFIPEETGYWTYLGSLTTPPCNESVIWILFKQPIEVSEDQLAAFRTLRSYCDGEECPRDELQGQVLVNYRPPLPLGGRQLRGCRTA